MTGVEVDEAQADLGPLPRPRVPRRRAPRPSPAVAALSVLPAGAGLAAALAQLDVSALSGHDVVHVAQAWARLANHARGMLYTTAAEVMRRTDPEFGVDDDWLRRGYRLPGTSELQAALVLTRYGANRLSGLTRDLVCYLPDVLAAMVAGDLDQPRAWIFAEWTAWLSQAHTDAVVAAVLPQAAKLTTAQLIRALQEAAIALDPEWARRRYEHALRGRRVHGSIEPDGTATLAGYQLPGDEVAAACDRLDTIARALKTAGHPDPIDAIRADIYLGLLTGRHDGTNPDHLLHRLLADLPTPANAGPPQAPDDSGGGPDPKPVSTSDGGPASGAAPALRGRGLRLRVELASVAGLRARPGELLGHGFVHAQLARRIATAAHARWCYVLHDAEGRPLAVGRIRTRPTHPITDQPPYGNVEVWLTLTPTDLPLLTEHGPPGWDKPLAELAHHLATNPGGPPPCDPVRRLPNTALRQWLHIRDHTCTFPGCRVPAHHSDTDHLKPYSSGGPTTAANLAAACGPHHALRHEHGWHVHADPNTPGVVTWISHLGHHYTRMPLHPTTLDPMPHATTAGDDDEPTEIGELIGRETCLWRRPPPPPEAPKPKPPPPAVRRPDDDIPPF